MTVAEPLQLLAALHYLVLGGRASWDDPRAALRDERAFVEDWLASRGVHTNEVRRCWALLPCFLEAARRTGATTLDCVELGCSGGLNLVWDRFGYAYEAGRWGPASTLLLGGEERRPVPRDVLATDVTVRSRVGVDRDPPDLRRDEGVRLLQSFVWPGQTDRLERLGRAVEAWRSDPPEIVTGDIVDELPRLLGRRRDDALMLVWTTSAFVYLPPARRSEARRLLAAAGAVGPLAFVEDRGGDAYGLVLRLWPGGEPVEVVRCDFHGAWVEWLL